MPKDYTYCAVCHEEGKQSWIWNRKKRSQPWCNNCHQLWDKSPSKDEDSNDTDDPDGALGMLGPWGDDPVKVNAQALETLRHKQREATAATYFLCPRSRNALVRQPPTFTHCCRQVRKDDA